jgi:hypothetical protein
VALAQNADIYHVVASGSVVTDAATGHSRFCIKNEDIHGKFMKDGDRLVPSDTADKMTYQLDDQQKAKTFLSKLGRAADVSAAFTGIIRVSAIEPVA